MIIIRILFFLFMLLLTIGLVVALLFAVGIRKAIKRFRNSAGQTGSSSGYNTNRNQRQWGQKSQNYDGDETIIDQRSPEEANRKIFSESDGEYVDFTEE